MYIFLFDQDYIFFLNVTSFDPNFNFFIIIIILTLHFFFFFL